MNIKTIGLILGAVLIVIFFSAAFIVDETQQVVITQFGRVIGEPIMEPGLNFRIPFIQKPNYFKKNLLEWDGEPDQIPTLDKTYIYVDAFARWKITDPVIFFQTVNSEKNALSRLNDIIDPAVRNFITSYRLVETVRKSNRELDTFEIGLHDASEKGSRQRFVINTGREKITKSIMEQAQPKLEKFGIELVDVKIKRVNYVEQVRESVYDRMIAERKQIAEKFRSEGQGEAKKILGEKERELKLITSEAYKTAQEIKGAADSEVTAILAEAYGVDPEFYSFVKTLEMYNLTLDDKSALVLSTDSEFFKYLKNYSGKAGSAEQE